MSPLRAVSLKVTLNPLAAEPYALVAVTPIRLSSTVKPPLLLVK